MKLKKLSSWIFTSFLALLIVGGTTISARSYETEIGYTTSTIAVIPNGSPNTGDTTGMLLYIVVALVSFIVFLMILSSVFRDSTNN